MKVPLLEQAVEVYEVPVASAGQSCHGGGHSSHAASRRVGSVLAGDPARQSPTDTTALLHHLRH